MSKRHEQLIEKIQKALKYIKSWTISLIIREMQVAATLRYYFLPVTRTKIQKLHNIFCTQATRNRVPSIVDENSNATTSLERI